MFLPISDAPNPKGKPYATWTIIGLMALLCLVTAAPGTAQVAEQPPEPTPAPTPIPASDIPTRAAGAADFAREAVTNAAPDARLQEIQQSFPGEEARISQLRETTAKQLQLPGPASVLKETEKSWVRTRDRLDRWLLDLSTRSSALDASLDDLQSRSSLWRLTRDHESGAALPKAVIQQIADTIETLEDAERQVRSARDTILDLQASISQEKSLADDALATQQREIAKRTKGVLGIDSPPLWKAFRAQSTSLEQFQALRREHWRSLKAYIDEQGSAVLIWVLLWPALSMLMVVMQRKAQVWVQQDKSLKTAVTLFGRPVAAALLVTALLNAILQPRAPSAWTGVIALVLALAVLRVLPGLLPRSLRLAPSLTILLYVLQQVVRLTPAGSPLYRVALLALAAGGMATALWLIRTLKAHAGKLSTTWYQWLLYGAGTALVLFALGAMADVLGSVDFSTLVLTGTTHGVLAAVVMGVLGVILRSMVRIALVTEAAHRRGIAPDHSATVRKTLFTMISIFSILGWSMFLLKGFLLFDPLLAALRSALDWSFTIGSFSIDPGDLLIFGFFIWLSLKIATFVQFILNVDLLPRADLPRGVPETISSVTRYLVIVLGAVIASAAAGLDISKVTIILGALGVGVGFGLQNIVNNFVSGLILLFERPIRVGDTLELDDTGGVVESIGLRASIVNTWDGAEIIVPNANLISQNVCNWTLNHDRHRIVISVGVAYGTDPEKAALLIVGVANDHQDVDARPEPSCLFVGFGDSSLDFQLRAWTAESRYMRVASDLRFAIIRTLNEAGIEIPFPQHDVHLLTPAPETGSAPGTEK